MSLAGAAAAMGLPEALVQRSAEARAAETGQSVDEILAAWAGGEAVAAPPPAAEPEPASSADAEEAPAEEPEPALVPDVVIETPEPVSGAAPTRAPLPAEVTMAEALHIPEVVTVPTAGIKERTSFVIPRWLTFVMLIVPLFALFALGGASTGACGEATELQTDVVTGEIVNCDGSEFTGSQIGGGGPDFIAMGGDIYDGSLVAGVNCAGCHGANGQGVGTFPPLTGTLTTFGSCTDHIEWVTVGSNGFTEQGTYGDTNKPVAGGMPAFSSTLTPEQIAAVSAFERVRFGGEEPDSALVDCGLAEPEEGEGGDGGEGSEGEDGTNTEGGDDGTMDESTDAAALRRG